MPIIVATHLANPVDRASTSGGSIGEHDKQVVKFGSVMKSAVKNVFGRNSEVQNAILVSDAAIERDDTVTQLAMSLSLDGQPARGVQPQSNMKYLRGRSPITTTIQQQDKSDKFVFINTLQTWESNTTPPEPPFLISFLSIGGTLLGVISVLVLCFIVLPRFCSRSKREEKRRQNRMPKITTTTEDCHDALQTEHLKHGDRPKAFATTLQTSTLEKTGSKEHSESKVDKQGPQEINEAGHLLIETHKSRLQSPAA